jgi:hypothetical protein
MSKHPTAMTGLLLAMAAGGLLALQACGSGGDSLGDTRAACYPPCLANLVKKCPLVSACMVNIQKYNPDISDPMQTDGVSACYADGEKVWDTFTTTTDEIVYVETPDGAECYEVVEAPFVSGALDYTIYAAGQAVATYDWRQSTNVTTVTCSDGTSATINTALPCGAFPWLNGGAGCDEGVCSFGALPVAPVGD